MLYVTWKLNQIRQNGKCLVTSPHTSASLIVNENTAHDVLDLVTSNAG